MAETIFLRYRRMQNRYAPGSDGSLCTCAVIEHVAAGLFVPEA
jgi:hypothetical protein